MVVVDRTVEPNPAIRSTYDDLFGRYTDLYSALREWGA
jgi:sugar (pentulose or hexulose) kinase